jgi:predicted ATPase
MRLQSIFISEYKNLKNFGLDFDGQSFIDVFVGKNGTGKSNFFEALIEIFRHLYEFGSHEIIFDYSIKYEIDDKSVEIAWKNEQLTINGKIEKSVRQIQLPDNVLIYYSGHNTKVHELVHLYEESFKGKIKTAHSEDAREFIGIGKEYKKLLLAVLLLQKDDTKAKEFICKKLGIQSIANVVKVILKRPSYAVGKKDFDIVNNDGTDRFWKPEGITKDFLNKLSECKSDDSKGPVRNEGYFGDKDEYILYFDITTIQTKFADNSLQELFRQFDNLKTIEMLEDISIEIALENGTKATSDHFSDGQFQSVYIYSIIELFKDRNCLTLLDEPDSFLHPEWQFEFLKQVSEIKENTVPNNHVLMSSHSAVTLIAHENKKIKFFDIKDNKVNCYDLPKRIAINKLSCDLIQYSEEEQLLSIINTIQIEKKPVLFTEGSTDPIILKEAWYKLYDEEIPFIPFYAFSCTYLSQLLTDDTRIVAEMDGLSLFGMFDFDKAYNQWNGIKGEDVETDPFKGLIKKRKEKEVYAIMLPVPKNECIKKQVIKSEHPVKTFGDASHCEMEHIFYGSNKTESFFKEEPSAGGKIIVFRSDADKKEFAKNVVPTVEKEYFEAFRPIFEFIKSKCGISSLLKTS